ncbi:hypothetical protein R1flu_004387 [Riccia fluitans]|uniref:F-box domain-containing protein n=1 Tax=Riccia fluitans TaxID=41844 RepID=A0ABD1YQF3_9MARC
MRARDEKLQQRSSDRREGLRGGGRVGRREGMGNQGRCEREKVEGGESGVETLTYYSGSPSSVPDPRHWRPDNRPRSSISAVNTKFFERSLYQEPREKFHSPFCWNFVHCEILGYRHEISAAVLNIHRAEAGIHPQYNSIGLGRGCNTSPAVVHHQRPQVPPERDLYDGKCPGKLQNWTDHKSKGYNLLHQPQQRGADHQSWARMRAPGKGQGNKIDPAKTDITASLSDALLRRILLSIPPELRAPCGLVCQRWLRILDKDRKELRLLDWKFLESGRLPKRFPDLTYVDLTWACMRDPSTENSICITLCNNLTLPLHPTGDVAPFSLQASVRSQQLSPEALDRGLAVLAKGCKELQRLRIVDVGHVQSGSFSEWEFVASNQDGAAHKGDPEVMLIDVSTPRKPHKIMITADDDNVVTADEKKGATTEIMNPKGGNLTDDDDVKPLKSILIKPREMDDEGFKISTALHKLDRLEGLGSRVVAQAALTRTHPNLTASLGPIEDDTETPRSRRAKANKGKGDPFGEVELGLLTLAKGCPMLQDLEVYQCTDETISAVVQFPNVQILRLVGSVEGFSKCSFTDVGLTILANKCRRLIKLELIGCEAGYAGIAALGQCCEMLEELTLSSSGFEEGWIAALGHYGCLKTLRLENCKYIDRQPGPVEDLKRCPTLERLQLVCCDLRDRAAFGALITVCKNAKELEFQDCWGLDDETFALTAQCRKIRLLYLDGCSLITAAGLEEIILLCNDLQRLRVVHCNNIRESELSLKVDAIIVTLKEFRWRPDTKSLLTRNPNINQAGRWFLRKP